MGGGHTADWGAPSASSGKPMIAITRSIYPELLPMIDCPRWDYCAAPICPLDPQKHLRDGPFAGNGNGASGEPLCELPAAELLELLKAGPERTGALANAVCVKAIL